MSSYIYISPHKIFLQKWAEDNGERLRLEYDLSTDATVFDVGGYRGQWASDIFAKYGCKVYIFEPVKKYSDEIKKRFAKNQNILVFPFGLSNKNTQMNISVLEDGSSVFRHGKETENIELRDIIDIVKQQHIKQIDLIKINIEGGEYDLLTRILDTDLHKKIVDLQIQFHKVIPNADEMINDIRSRLKKTHSQTYCYPFVWENWRLKNK